MEHQSMLMSTVCLALLVVSCSALPTDDSVLQNSGLRAEKLPKHMETRDMDIFKYMLLSSIQELVEEGQLNSAILNPGAEEDQGDMKSVAKRMQYMGICMRRRENTFIPYPCLRSGRR